MSMICSHWGSRSSVIAHVRAPASWLGGRALGFWRYDRRQEAAAGAAALMSRPWSPPSHRRRQQSMGVMPSTWYIFEEQYICNERLANMCVNSGRPIFFFRHLTSIFSTSSLPTGRGEYLMSPVRQYTIPGRERCHPS